VRYAFDEIQLRDEFISALKEVFADEYDTLKTEVEVIASENQDSSFPCCVVSLLNPLSNERYADNEGTFHKINVSLTLDLYSKKLDKYSFEDSIIKLSQIAISGLLDKYSNLVITRNNKVPYRTDVLRRNVTFRMTYDVQNKHIYSN
jgi:hypothetical protein